MNIDKLLKAIQIIIEVEIKRQLPKIKEELIESIKHIEPVHKKPISSTLKAVLGEDLISKKQVKYSSNPLFNDILNETRTQAADTNDTEFPSLKFDSGDVEKLAMRKSMAEKMGYGDMMNMTTNSAGAPVNMNNEAVKTVVNAMNRDYTELVQHFKK